MVPPESWDLNAMTRADLFSLSVRPVRAREMCCLGVFHGLGGVGLRERGREAYAQRDQRDAYMTAPP
jgi:hypothetical protein